MHAKRFILTGVILMLILAVSALDYSPGQLLFKTSAPISIKSGKTGLAEFDSYLSALGVKSLSRLTGMPGQNYYSVTLNRDPDWSAVKSGELRFAGIEYIQPNYLNKMLVEPNDPLYPNQLHALCALPQAWNYTTGTKTVKVGIVDSGILRDHPDLSGNIYYNVNEIPGNGIDDDNNGYVDDWCGWDFCDAPEMADQALGDYLDPDNDNTDENYHGTHVAGIVGAVGNNGIGVTGVAWNISILAVRAGFRTLGGSGFLQDDDAAAAVIYATDMGCNVINMSWGDANYSPIIADACEYAHSRGVSLVASAGNDPVAVLSYPARLSNVISVGAINKSRVLAGFSSYGVDLDLVAPGEGVLSTYKTNEGEQYMQMNGTSMSSPYVTGAIALLYSLYPALTPEEVRSRLLTSCDDLGAQGYDLKYGHGLLNVKRLLDNLEPPLICIDSPYEMAGINQSFDIQGTITGDNFFRYSVMRSNKTTPSAIDWRNVADDTAQPIYYSQPVENGTIATFNVPDAMAEGKYIIRIQFEDIYGGKFNMFRTVVFDNSPPSLRTETLIGFKRYDKQNLKYYASAKFNEQVRSHLKITASDGSIFYSYATNLDSLQVWALPSDIPPGDIDIVITANNISGLLYQSDTFTDFMTIEYAVVNTFGWNSRTVGKARVPLSKTYDFDGNGTKEYFAMDLPVSGYGRVYAYEPTTAGHVMKYDYNDNFWLLGLGNTNTIGMELLSLKADRAYLRETAAGGLYPNTVVWADSSISGGTIATYMSGGTTGVLLVKNLPAENVIKTYSRDAQDRMTERNTLHNTTLTSLRNTYVPTILVENLDGDATPDVLCADTDGDIMIYEIYNQNSAQMTWHTRLPVANTYQLGVGDFDGNGSKDFIAGGYYTDQLNPDMNFWYFEGFTRTGNNNFTSMGSIMFNDVQSQNAITTEDLDNDGKTEIVLALSPNLYTIKYQNGDFVPNYYGQSFRTYQIGTWRDSMNGVHFMTNYAVTADSVVAMEWYGVQSYSGPPTPILLHVRPMNEHTADLKWLDNGADAYRIYRMNDDGQIVILGEVSGTTYQDTGLVSGKTYKYSITGLDSDYNPGESSATLWREVIPNLPPEVTEIMMVGVNQLRLTFNQRMSPDIINPGYFFLNHDYGIPTSVNVTENHQGVILRFSRHFTPDIDDYVLSLRNVSGSTGVQPLITEYGFDYLVDTEAPQIVDTTVLPGNTSILIEFTEELDPTGIDNPANFRLDLPVNDPDNSIQSVSYSPAGLQVVFSHKLKYSGQPYYLTLYGMHDLAGNTLSRQFNSARFLLTDIVDLSKLKVYPNPAGANSGDWVTFINFPSDKKGRIAIFSSSGTLVYGSSIGPFNPENNNIAWRWNMVNQSGRKVSSGIYFYVIEMGGMSAKGKFAIIK